MSPNYPTLADVGIDINYHTAAFMQPSKEPFTFQRLKRIPIGVLKIFPGIQFDLFKSLLSQPLKGIVIETFGAGNIPQDGKELLPMIQRAFEQGTIVTVTSQCVHGTVSLGTYEASSGLKQAGAVSGYDITTEACVAKLYYLFSKGYDSNKIKELMETDLRGECTL